MIAITLGGEWSPARRGASVRLEERFAAISIAMGRFHAGHEVLPVDNSEQRGCWVVVLGLGVERL